VLPPTIDWNLESKGYPFHRFHFHSVLLQKTNLRAYLSILKFLCLLFPLTIAPLYSVQRVGKRSCISVNGWQTNNHLAIQNTETLKYLNRLSDWFFVAARCENENGETDTLWIPGSNQ
jgi:hypothetical protein